MLVPQLQSVKGWSPDITCVPTTICGVTLMFPDQATGLLSVAGFLLGKVLPVTPQSDYPVEVWATALKMFGWKLKRELIGDDKEYGELPTIEEYMSFSLNNGVRLVFCVQEQGSTHLFAANGNEYVDSNNGGKRLVFTGVLETLGGFRVKHTFRPVHMQS